MDKGITFNIRLRTGGDYKKAPAWHSVVRRGALFQDPKGGKIIEMFKIAVFAEAIDRSASTIREWEAAKMIPPPVFLPAGAMCRHWYTAAQVLNAHNLWIFQYRGLKYRSKQMAEAFTKDLTALWYQPEILPVTTVSS